MVCDAIKRERKYAFVHTVTGAVIPTEAMSLKEIKHMANECGDPLFRSGGEWIYQMDSTGDNYRLVEVKE